MYFMIDLKCESVVSNGVMGCFIGFLGFLASHPMHRVTSSLNTHTDAIDNLIQSTCFTLFQYLHMIILQQYYGI